QFQHALEVYGLVRQQIEPGTFADESGWRDRQGYFWRTMADRAAVPDISPALQEEMGGVATLRQTEALAKGLLLLGDPGDMVGLMEQARHVAWIIGPRFDDSAARQPGPITD